MTKRWIRFIRRRHGAGRAGRRLSGIYTYALNVWALTGGAEISAPKSATVVHHIKPLAGHPEMALDLDNLESLCDACHNKKHPEKGAGRQDVPTRIAGVRIVKV